MSWQRLYATLQVAEGQINQEREAQFLRERDNQRKLAGQANDRKKA